MLTGCAQGGTAHAARDATTQRPTGVTQSPSTASTPTADSRACVGVEAIIGHLTADTARWSPNLDPFDPAISARIRTWSKALARQESLATSSHLQAVVGSNARAFAEVADAMAAKNRAKVSHAVDASKVAYGQLKGLCSLD
jgi:hypothetical protein